MSNLGLPLVSSSSPRPTDEWVRAPVHRNGVERLPADSLTPAAGKMGRAARKQCLPSLARVVGQMQGKTACMQCWHTPTSTDVKRKL